MTAIRLVRTVDLPVAAGAAWDVVAAYARDPEWRTGVLAMSASPGPLAVGTTTDERLRLAGRVWHNLGVVTDLDPGRRLAWRTTEGAVAHGARTVQPLGTDRCQVRLDLTATPQGAERLVAPILRRLLARHLDRDVQRLAALLTEVSTSG